MKYYLCWSLFYVMKLNLTEQTASPSISHYEIVEAPEVRP